VACFAGHPDRTEILKYKNPEASGSYISGSLSGRVAEGAQVEATEFSV